jgi:hypothetical protein
MDRYITCDICHKKLTKGYGMHRKACERKQRNHLYALVHSTTTPEKEPGALVDEKIAPVTRYPQPSHRQPNYSKQCPSTIRQSGDDVKL